MKGADVQTSMCRWNNVDFALYANIGFLEDHTIVIYYVRAMTRVVDS